MNCSLRTAVLTLSLCYAVTSAIAQAAPRSETLLPDTTTAYVSVADLGVLRASFNQTQWGQLVHDPAMQSFVDDFRHQLQQKGMRQLEDLGLSWPELEGVPGGEISVALVHPEKGRMAAVVLVDVTGHRDRAVALIEKIGVNLNKRGAQRLRDASQGAIVYDLPAEDGKRANRQAACFLKDDLLIVTDDLGVLRKIVAAQAGAAEATDRAGSLAHLKSFSEIMARCDKSAGGVSPQVRWFVEPFGYADMIRETTLKKKRVGIDLVQALRSQGFAAIQGLGGYINFGADQCDLVHRTMVYAPPVIGHEETKEKYELAARMLKFPVAGDLEPQNWVPKQVATYNSFNWDIKSAFASIGPLVDEVMAEKGVFHDVLDSLKNDPQGPKVDIEKDLVGNLGSRVTVITDYELPIGPKSEHLLVGIETTNETMVAETIAKTMKGDARRREFEGHVIWEIVDEESAVPELKIENPEGGDIAHADREDDKAESKKPHEGHLMQNAAVTVAFGHLFVSSNLGFLQNILHQAGSAESLASAPDYRYVAKQMKAFGGEEISFRMFSRTDLEYRPTYELIRTGQMPKSETILGQILNGLLGDGKEGVVRKQKIDGTKLPEFGAVSHYFGPAGTFCSSERNGWFILGFMIDKARLGAEGAKDIVEETKPLGGKGATSIEAAPTKEAPIKPSASISAPSAVTAKKLGGTTKK